VAYEYEDEFDACILTRKHFLISFIVSILIFVLPMIIISIVYGMIICHTKDHTHIHPKNGNTLRTKRNMKVFKNFLIYTNILGINGTPYFLSIIFNNIVVIAWPLY
jgi:hypothetical protein